MNLVVLVLCLVFTLANGRPTFDKILDLFLDSIDARPQQPNYLTKPPYYGPYTSNGPYIDEQPHLGYNQGYGYYGKDHHGQGFNDQYNYGGDAGYYNQGPIEYNQGYPRHPTATHHVTVGYKPQPYPPYQHPVDNHRYNYNGY